MSNSLNSNAKRRKDGGRAVPGRGAGLALIFALALIPGGCLGGHDEIEAARQKRDEYSAALQRLQQSNDNLKLEISDTYASCDLIGNQLTVVAAMNLHNRYTDGLGRRIPPEPIKAEKIPPRNEAENQGGAIKIAPKRDEGQGQGSKPGADGPTSVQAVPPPKPDLAGGLSNLDGMDLGVFSSQP